MRTGRRDPMRCRVAAGKVRANVVRLGICQNVVYGYSSVFFQQRIMVLADDVEVWR